MLKIEKGHCACRWAVTGDLREWLRGGDEDREGEEVHKEAADGWPASRGLRWKPEETQEESGNKEMSPGKMERARENVILKPRRD